MVCIYYLSASRARPKVTLSEDIRMRSFRYHSTNVAVVQHETGILAPTWRLLGVTGTFSGIQVLAKRAEVGKHGAGAAARLAARGGSKGPRGGSTPQSSAACGFVFLMRRLLRKLNVADISGFLL